MNTEPIIIKQKFEAPVAKVWAAITDKNLMKHWYFDIAEFKAVPGFEFCFTGGDKIKYLHLCKITEVIPFKKISYTWAYEGQNAETLVSFNLEEEGSNTKIELVHKGVEKLSPYGADFAKENFIKGWNYIIGTSLKQVVETMSINLSTNINAKPENVWKILTDSEKVKQWAAAFSEGTTVETNWSIGSEVIWKDGDGNIGAKGTIMDYNSKKNMVMRYYDNVDAEPGAPLDEYCEKYILDESNGSTILKIETGPIMKKYGVTQQPMWEDALQRIKAIAEK